MNVIATLFDNQLAYAFGWTMIHSLWQCTVIAAVLAVSLRISRNHSASLRYVQGILALSVCLIVSGITFHRYYSDIVIADQTVGALGSNVQVSYTGGLWEQVYVALNSSVDYIVLFWLLGFAVQFYRYSRDFVQAYALRNRGCEDVGAPWKTRFDRLAGHLGLTRAIAFKNSCRVTSTCIIGHFRPVVLLPIGLLTSMSTDQIEALVLHELAHIKRNDYLINAVQCFVRLLYFFNPAVLWISSKIDIERENACDDIAVAHCGDPALYANGLAGISELELKLATVLAANKNQYQVLPRVKRLFSGAPGVSKSMEKLVTAVCVSLVILTMNVGAEQYDFLKAGHETVAAETGPAAGSAIRDAAAEKPAPPTQSMASESRPEPERSPEPEPNTAAPERHETVAPPSATPDTPSPAKVEATPEIDYAARSAATNKADAVSPPDPTDNMQLAAAPADNRNAAATSKTGGDEPLEAMQVPEFDQFYVASNFKLPLTRKIYVADAEVVFAPVWMKRFRSRTSEAYRDITVRDYGQGFKSELKKALGNAGWEVVDTPADDAIRLQPRLFDLYIFAPESVGLKQTIVAYAGQSGVELVFQGPDARPFIKIVDYRKTRESAGSPFIANRATNFKYFQMLMSDWSDDAIKYLENVMSIAEGQNRGQP